MLNRLVFVVIAAIITGCASTYTPSPRMLQLKQGMNKQAGVAILAKYSKPSPGNGGFCGGNNLTFDKGMQLAVDAEGYSIQAYKRGELVSTERTGSITTYTYKKVPYRAVRRFSDITKIRVAQGSVAFENCPNMGKTGYGLSVHYSVTDSDAFHVADAGLDEVLAALAILAPQAPLIQGLGV